MGGTKSLQVVDVNPVCIGLFVLYCICLGEVVVRLLLLQPFVAIIPLGDFPDQRYDPGVLERHKACRDVFLPRCVHLVQDSLGPDCPPE